MSICESELMLKKFRGLPFDGDLRDCKNIPTKISETPFSEAFALNNMVTNIAIGICGDQSAYLNAFVRSNAVTGCL